MQFYARPSWVQSLSFGGLTKTSLPWQKNVKLSDKWFIKIHNKDNFKFNNTRIVIKTTKLRQRVFVRTEYINIKK